MTTENPDSKILEETATSEQVENTNEYKLGVNEEVSEVLNIELIEKAKIEAVKVVKEAGDILLQLLGKVDFEFKDDGSHVTKADTQIQELIQNHLSNAFSNINFIGEEGEDTEVQKSDFEWVVDPLDGTINFGNNIDFFAISVGLKYKNTPVMGVVYVPAQKELITGDINGKSTCNGVELEESTEQIHNKKPFADGVWNKNTIAYSDEAAKLKGKPRTMGTAVHTLVDVAKGGFGHAVLSNVFIWDILAAMPILRGAGADLLVWQDGQWKKYEEIDPALFNKTNSFTVLAAGNTNMDYLKANITVDKSKEFDFTDEKPAFEISTAEKKEVEYDPEVLDKFQSLFAKISEITRNVINTGKKEITLKEDDSEQTNEDIRIEEELKELLLAEFPDFNFMGEETPNVLTDSRYGFIVDPIDGTTNYSNNLPSFATIVCLTFDNKPIGGLIYFPKLDMAVFNNADSTLVSRFNDKKEAQIEKVQVKDDLFDSEDANIPFGFGSHARRKIKYNKEVAKVFNQPRTFGSAASIISFTGTGSLRGFILTDAKLYDYAGGVPLIENGGGQVFILDEDDNCWKEYDEMFEKLMKEPEVKRYVIGGGPNSVKKLMENMHPEVK